MPHSVKGFFEINADMVQILLMLEALFTQDSKVDDLFCFSLVIIRWTYQIGPNYWIRPCVAAIAGSVHFT